MTHLAAATDRDMGPAQYGRLALGTVQFGLPYGVTNASGQVPANEVHRILARAAVRRVLTLDTAALYGGSEDRLGSVGVRNFDVVTKLPELPADTTDVLRWVREQLGSSLARLGLAQVDGLLLHRPAALTGGSGPALWAALEAVREEGLVRRIGYSVYEPGELSALYSTFRADLVQLPYNVLDRRFESSGWLDRLSANGTVVHSRSVFLQGLLLAPRNSLPDKFGRWQPHFNAWHDWCDANSLTPLEAALGHSLANVAIDRVLFGVVNLAQFDEILSSVPSQIVKVPMSLASSDLDLVNPSRWSST